MEFNLTFNFTKFHNAIARNNVIKYICSNLHKFIKMNNLLAVRYLFYLRIIYELVLCVRYDLENINGL